MRKGQNLIALVAMVVLCALINLPIGAEAQGPKTVYVGGSFALTGAYSQDVAAMLSAFEDYVKYVNETKRLAPWRNEKWPSDITIELLWRDDELKPAKAITIYEELKGKGMLVFRCSGSPQAVALKDKLAQDNMGTTIMATGPFLMTPPGTIFTHYPIYTDDLAAVADWFKTKWKESRKPRVAYLTADNAMGKTIEVPEMEEYLKKVGYEFVGIQYVPVVPVSPPTTQLMWLRQNKVDLALGVMVQPGSQPTVKEMVRLGMGPHLDYKVTFAAATPSHLPTQRRRGGQARHRHGNCRGVARGLRRPMSGAGCQSGLAMIHRRDAETPRNFLKVALSASLRLGGESFVRAMTPALFLDRDGVLMEDVHYCADPALVRVYPGAGEALRRRAPPASAPSSSPIRAGSAAAS